ncbi:MAG TPA: AMP-binding protein, partial [Flavobacterium sp.]|nr:AMP-binding protein [Flavobacterium sp.]
MFQLFNLSLKANGFPMKEATAEFEKILTISDGDYENYIDLKRKEIVEYH